MTDFKKQVQVARIAVWCIKVMATVAIVLVLIAGMVSGDIVDFYTGVMFAAGFAMSGVVSFAIVRMWECKALECAAMFGDQVTFPAGAK